jgi:hypothetical protein
METVTRGRFASHSGHWCRQGKLLSLYGAHSITAHYAKYTYRCRDWAKRRGKAFMYLIATQVARSSTLWTGSSAAAGQTT